MIYSCKDRSPVTIFLTDSLFLFLPIPIRMKSMIFPILAALAFMVTSAFADLNEVLSIHGSGTTNPSKCYWHIHDEIEDRARLPLKLTYRAIGSSDGQDEFIRSPTVSDFGSGDIPLNKTSYQAVKGNVLHLPVLIGAVSFFHSVPNTPALNLTACTLAKILTRQITHWDDTEIQSLNPEMNLDSAGFPIRVVHRVDGSSSTAGISEVRYFCSAFICIFTPIFSVFLFMFFRYLTKNTRLLDILSFLIFFF